MHLPSRHDGPSLVRHKLLRCTVGLQLAFIVARICMPPSRGAMAAAWGCFIALHCIGGCAAYCATTGHICYFVAKPTVADVFQCACIGVRCVDPHSHTFGSARTLLCASTPQCLQQATFFGTPVLLSSTWCGEGNMPQRTPSDGAAARWRSIYAYAFRGTCMHALHTAWW